MSQETIADGRIGKNESVVSMVLDNLNQGGSFVFQSPTGSGRSHIVSEAIRRWKTQNDGVIVVISPNMPMALQWKNHGLEATGRMKARIEAKKQGTVMGHALDTVSLVVIEESDYGRPGDVKAIKDLFPRAGFLCMAGLKIIDRRGA